MKKVVLVLMFAYSCYASMPWESGWEMGGTSTYSIIDKNNNQLLLECNDMNKNIYLRNERRDSFNFDSTIKMKLDNKEINTLAGVDDETKSKDKFIWNDLINNLSKAKKISIYTNNKEYIFEPNNSDKIQDILDTCKINSEMEQEKDVNQTPLISNKQPFQFKFDSGYNQVYGISYPILIITSLNDQLVIKDIKINKGKCRIGIEPDAKFDAYRNLQIIPKKFPISIPEYIAQKFDISSGCNVLRMDIETNNGTWTFEEN